MQSVKIQINSVEALNRLIGGDSELEIEVRQGVACALAEKHLKPLVNSPAFVKAKSEIEQGVKSEINKAIATHVGTLTYDNWSRVNGFNLNENLKTGLNEAIRKTVNTIISEQVDKAVAAIDIEKYVNNLVNYEVKRRVDKEVAEKFDKIKLSL